MRRKRAALRILIADIEMTLDSTAVRRDGTVRIIIRVLEVLTDSRFNSVLLNLYRDHNDRMAFHSDCPSSDHLAQLGA